MGRQQAIHRARQVSRQADAVLSTFGPSGQTIGAAGKPLAEDIGAFTNPRRSCAGRLSQARARCRRREFYDSTSQLQDHRAASARNTLVHPSVSATDNAPGRGVTMSPLLAELVQLSVRIRAEGPLSWGNQPFRNDVCVSRYKPNIQVIIMRFRITCRVYLS